MAQPPETEGLWRFYEEACVVVLVVRALCQPSTRNKGALRMCDNVFFLAQKTSRYQRVSLFKLFWASRQLYLIDINYDYGDRTTLR